jgi:hypothetical protein
MCWGQKRPTVTQGTQPTKPPPIAKPTRRPRPTFGEIIKALDAWINGQRGWPPTQRAAAPPSLPPKSAPTSPRSAPQALPPGTWRVEPFVSSPALAQRHPLHPPVEEEEEEEDEGEAHHHLTGCDEGGDVCEWSLVQRAEVQQRQRWREERRRQEREREQQPLVVLIDSQSTASLGSAGGGAAGGGGLEGGEDGVRTP